MGSAADEDVGVPGLLRRSYLKPEFLRYLACESRWCLESESLPWLAVTSACEEDFERRIALLCPIL